MDLCRVAGGVLWREDGGGSRLAVIHRPSRGDWSLPKGRLDRGEAWHEAALREIAEETGCEARLTRFAGAKLFLERDVPKLVLYWHMQALRVRPLEDEGEVDEVAWLTPRAALQRLDHPSDRRLLLRCLSDGAWRRRAGPAPRGEQPVDGEGLQQRLVVDGRCRSEELAPFLRIIEKAVAADRRTARFASGGRG